MFRKILCKSIFCLILIVVLSACGGSSGSSKPESTSLPSITDITPESLMFKNKKAVQLNSLVFSNSVEIIGINVPVEVSITGGEYSINGSQFTSEKGTVIDGDSIVVRLTSAATKSTISLLTLTVANIESTFSATTYELYLMVEGGLESANMSAKPRIITDLELDAESIDQNTVYMKSIGSPTQNLHYAEHPYSFPDWPIKGRVELIADGVLQVTPYRLLSQNKIVEVGVRGLKDLDGNEYNEDFKFQTKIAYDVKQYQRVSDFVHMRTYEYHSSLITETVFKDLVESVSFYEEPSRIEYYSRISSEDEGAISNYHEYSRGKDYEWFTADDLVVQARRHVSGKSEVGVLYSSSAGDDGVWLTDDDRIVQREVYELNAQGYWDYKKYANPGADNAWYTIDDELKSQRKYLSQPDKNRVIETYYNYSDVGMKLNSVHYLVYAYNDQGFVTSTQRFYGGEDLQPFTNDDELQSEDTVEYERDNDGMILSYTIKYSTGFISDVEMKPDLSREERVHRYMNSERILLSCIKFHYENGNLVKQETFYDDDNDGGCFSSGDNRRSFHEKKYEIVTSIN